MGRQSTRRTCQEKTKDDARWPQDGSTCQTGAAAIDETERRSAKPPLRPCLLSHTHADCKPFGYEENKVGRKGNRALSGERGVGTVAADADDAFARLRPDDKSGPHTSQHQTSEPRCHVRTAQIASMNARIAQCITSGSNTVHHRATPEGKK
eukprot:575009-Rhodomonas_salina.2